MARKTSFYGKWIVAAAFLTYGIAVGLPYYTVPFFYDYFQSSFSWARSQITLGFPLAALLTLWVGPVLVPRFRARTGIVIGAGLTCLAFLGYSRMGANIYVYYFFCLLYTSGYLLSGPIPNQLIVSYWFRRYRGTAMAIVYAGAGAIAALGSWMVKRITEATNFHIALIAVGLVMLVVWPIAIFVLRERPSDIGQFPDGDSEPPPEAALESRSFGYLLRRYPFWLLLAGSFCSIGSIGAIASHMKFVFEDQGFHNQAARDSVWAASNIIIVSTSMGGRLVMGILADWLSVKWVTFATYFMVAASIPLLLLIAPPGTPWAFALLFGFAMGADYMLIPLLAARQFGVNSLARAMALILPVNQVGQTWFPYFVSLLREHSPNYKLPFLAVFVLAIVGAFAIALMPSRGVEDANNSMRRAAAAEKVPK